MKRKKKKNLVAIGKCSSFDKTDKDKSGSDAHKNQLGLIFQIKAELWSFHSVSFVDVFKCWLVSPWKKKKKSMGFACYIGNAHFL